ncbi:neutral amino acid ABC transporter membrane protein [Halothece sp. PCC 7418]|uniref:branched-chain amino acid ABC transporter permease n=1 Tax=Halothece sp. (strain PCC 7418) TaxID=65093 RepID=UPI0002A081D5|nr:branched-chain amino acid ABC transporter permease [Halothece sp. PCC 7418]AFZ45469.1 neutral amino acid ABC transporter membrane protein [Halothece sp. PCC 7418]
MVSYLVFLTISTGIFAIFALGLNIQWGYTGLINFGHVAFMTVGAYTTILLSLQGVPIFMAAIAGAVLAMLLGLLVGLSTLRLREDYLAIVTIGVSELLRLIALNEEWLTRGAFGVQGFPLPLGEFNPNWLSKGTMIFILSAIALFGLWQLQRSLKAEFEARKQQRGIKKFPFDLGFWGVFAVLLGGMVYVNGIIALIDYDYKSGLMLLILMTLTVFYLIVETLVRSPWGRVLKAIREDEQVPRALGKDVFWYKLQAFMLGGAIAGIAGAFYAWQLTTIYPSNFQPLISFYGWTIVVLGGAGNNGGVLLGAVIFWAYDSLTRFILPQLGWIDDARLGAFRILVIGLILMVLMVSRPQGILGKKEELTLGR